MIFLFLIKIGLSWKDLIFLLQSWLLNDVLFLLDLGLTVGNNNLKFQMNRGGRAPAGRGPAKKKVERPGLTEDEIEELREAFNLFDTEATGKIDPKYPKKLP